MTQPPMDALAALLPTVDAVLVGAGMSRVPTERLEGWPTPSAAYEDVYSIVAACEFDSVEALLGGWLDAQDRVVALLSANVTRMEPKAWDGYLVLLTSEPLGGAQVSEISEIRRDTRRLRKIVLTEDDIGAWPASGSRTVAVRRCLSPLLPLDLEHLREATDPLSDLPRRLADRGVPEPDARVVLSAYGDGRPMIGALHEHHAAERRVPKSTIAPPDPGSRP